MVNNNIMTLRPYLYAFLPGHNSSYNYIVLFCLVKFQVAQAKTLVNPGRVATPLLVGKPRHAWPLKMVDSSWLRCHAFDSTHIQKLSASIQI